MCIKPLQLTLAILKPDVVAHPHIVQEIRSMILKNGFYFVRSKDLHMTKARAEDFYEEHKGKFFLNRLVAFMSSDTSCSEHLHVLSSGPIWTHILARDDAIHKWRHLMGPTKVLKTIHEAPDTIRGQFGLTDTRNCTHGSDSELTAKREIEFFFPEFDIEKWHKEMGDAFSSGRVEFNEDTCQHIPILKRVSTS